MTISMLNFACAIVFGIGFGYPLGCTIDRWLARRANAREQIKWAKQCAAQHNAAIGAGLGNYQAAQMSNSNQANSGRIQ